MILETERLTIHQIDLGDAPYIYELMNSPKWLAYIGDRGIHTLENAKSYIQNNIFRDYNIYGFSTYKVILKATGEIVGTCGLHKRDYLDHPDIGYATLPQHEGFGYISEAAKGVLEYGKKVLKLEEILAITNVDNEGSQKLLTKIGLHFQRKTFFEAINAEVLVFSTGGNG
ncbi:GNAT family N-acetyltransferase [Flammeovirgaceae bacterium SG7u.111]|nr:GNAT family N-acetyltransferase [Flammeovirgaceae bacterium SG7u.132]WPO36426.1 GNAT family N-acetyltransferase [Flammeovirgaceae bacterium SG7u.111]